MEKEVKKRRKLKKFNVLVLLIVICVISFYIFNNFYNNRFKELVNKKENIMYLSNTIPLVPMHDGSLNKIKDIVRGTKVSVTKEKTTKEGKTYLKVKINKEELYVLNDNLAAKLLDVVKEEKVFVRTPSTVYEDIDKGKIKSALKKGDELNVVGYNTLLEDGTVDAYKIKIDETSIGYAYSKYLVADKESSLLNYEPEKYYDVHNKRKDYYSGVGGNGGNLDYYPVEKPKFEDNIMPEKVFSLYLNGGSNTIGSVDQYIEYAKSTKINAFTVDIKDNESPAYKSKIYETYSPTNYKYANNSFEAYKEAIKKIKDAGFYVIGRITVFKDKYYVLDNPDVAIMDNRTSKPFDTGTYWPSPFQRKVWEFNVNLAKEAVIEMGFDEIQFDYVRFPDRIVSQDKAGYLNFRNDYDEEKVQAIQRFLMYACDELHKLNTYVSADVFGESVNTYITAYGQYWPAISNVVDVISGMPYPDHFSVDSYGIPKPWEEPYRLMNSWSKIANSRQQEIPTPAVVRTWILAQSTMQGFVYNAEHIEAQIMGLYDAGLTGGYMTWSSSSSLQGYKNRNGAYSKEY